MAHGNFSLEFRAGARFKELLGPLLRVFALRARGLALKGECSQEACLSYMKTNIAICWLYCWLYPTPLNPKPEA